MLGLYYKGNGGHGSLVSLVDGHCVYCNLKSRQNTFGFEQGSSGVDPHFFLKWRGGLKQRHRESTSLN